MSERLGGIKGCKITVVVVSHIQRSIGCQSGKTSFRGGGGQSRSMSAEQGKENKIKSLTAYHPPHPPHCSFGEKKHKKTHDASTSAEYSR